MEQSTNNQWIKCSERLPEYTGVYLVYAPGAHLNQNFSESVCTADFWSDRRYGIYWYTALTSNTDYFNSKVTHWMPLPDLPKKGEVEL